METGDLSVLGDLSLDNTLILYDADGSAYITLSVPTSVTTYSLILPATAGTDGYSLTYGTGGQLAWTDVSGGGGSSSYTTTFTDASLSSGILTVTHSLNQRPVVVQVYDNNWNLILPDETTLTSVNVATIDLTSYGTISGTWSVIAAP